MSKSVSVTAKEFLDSKQSEDFRAACARVGIEPTKRQVRRWRRKTGKAYKEGRPS